MNLSIRLALGGFLLGLFLLVGCITSTDNVYLDADGNPIATNRVYGVDPRLTNTLDTLDSINAMIEPFNPEGGKTRVALTAIGGTLLTLSTAFAGWKNRRRLKKIAADASEGMTQFFRRK